MPGTKACDLPPHTGLSTCIGVELDFKRNEYANRARMRFDWHFPRVSNRLVLLTGSFLNVTDWSRGTDKRVVFLDAILFDQMWPDVAKLISTAEFNSDSVIAVIGKDAVGAAQREKSLTISRSQTGAGIRVHFFTKRV